VVAVLDVIDCVRCGSKSKQRARADLRFAPSLHSSMPAPDSTPCLHPPPSPSPPPIHAHPAIHRHGDTRNDPPTSSRTTLRLLSHVIAIVVGVNSELDPHRTAPAAHHTANMADPDTDSDLSSLPSLSPSPPPDDRSTSPPSSPLSFLSRSPTPTDFLEVDRASMANRSHAKVKIVVPYPSPPASQQTSASGSPSPDGMDSGMDARPSKRRRISRDPKNRTTEHLDLRSGTVSVDQQESLDRVLDTLLTRRKIVAIAGAGMSRSAGGMPSLSHKMGTVRAG